MHMLCGDTMDLRRMNLQDVFFAKLKKYALLYKQILQSEAQLQHMRWLGLPFIFYGISILMI